MLSVCSHPGGGTPSPSQNASTCIMSFQGDPSDWFQVPQCKVGGTSAWQSGYPYPGQCGYPSFSQGRIGYSQPGQDWVPPYQCRTGLVAPPPFRMGNAINAWAGLPQEEYLMNVSLLHIQLLKQKMLIYRRKAILEDQCISDLSRVLCTSAVKSLPGKFHVLFIFYWLGSKPFLIHFVSRSY